MGNISFELTHENGDLIKRSRTLKDIWWHIKTTINEPRNYCVDQLNDGEIEDTASAYYLVENYKTEETLPQLISDIPH